MEKSYASFGSQNIYASDQMAISNDGMRVMVASSYWGFVGVYSSADRALIWSIGPETNSMAQYFWADMSADGKVVVVVDSFGLVRYYKVDVGTDPIWTYNTSWALSSIAITADGSKFVVGGMGGAAYFDANGLLGTIPDPGVRYYCAISQDGKRAVLGHGSIASFYNSSMALKKNDLLPAAVSDVIISANGAYCASAMADGNVRSYQFYNTVSSTNFNWTQDFGAGTTTLTLSYDGRAMAVRTGDSYSLYSVAAAEVLWSKLTSRPPDGMTISGDGNYVAVCHYLGNEMVLLDRAGNEIDRMPLTEAWLVVSDMTGDTLAVRGLGLYVYRPGLQLTMDSDSWMVSAGITSGFGVKVTRGGVPVSGANLSITLSESVAAVTVTEQGNGRYWVTVLGADVEQTKMVTWNATASSPTFLNGTATGTLSVLPVDDPANYDSRLQELTERLGQAQSDLDQTKKDLSNLQTLQLITLVVGIILAMVVVFLMMRHARPPAAK